MRRIHHLQSILEYRERIERMERPLVAISKMRKPVWKEKQADRGAAPA